jgi:hypothetical protein
VAETAGLSYARLAALLDASGTALDQVRARLLPQFMRDYPELTRGWKVLYKPRGELIEPHTSHRVGGRRFTNLPA